MEILKKFELFVEELPSLTVNPPLNDEKQIKCTLCDFETCSDKGMKVHMTRKHTKISTVKYPKKCDLCEKQFGNAAEFKQHMKTHSYKEAKFKCEDCNFVGKSKETMEVHLGRSHTDLFECGLCEIDFKSSDNLETHLKTCEIFRCRRCYRKEKTITNIKAHAEKKHPGLQATLVDHMKISRNDKDEVTSKEHFHTNL